VVLRTYKAVLHLQTLLVQLHFPQTYKDLPTELTVECARRVRLAHGSGGAGSRLPCSRACDLRSLLNYACLPCNNFHSFSHKNRMCAAKFYSTLIS